MKTQCLHSDIISTLPDNIIEHILTLMPIQDALRTSVLSTKWRYSWRSMPKLAFSEHMVKECSSCPRLKKFLLVNAIFHVLLFHNGPTKLQFCYSFDDLQMVSEIDQIITYISRGSSVKELIFIMSTITRFYQLPVSFFSLQGLESIELQNCFLEPPLTFNGFSRLRKIVFYQVKGSAQMFQRFFSKCPLLEYICLIGDEPVIDSAAGGSKFTFADLLQCVPLVQTLDISSYYIKDLCAGGMSHKIPTSLVHLKFLFLDVCLMEHDEISSAFCIIRSSPVLEKIIIAMYDNEKLPVRKTPTNFFDPEDYSDLKLDHLETFRIEWFSNLPLEIEFVRLIMTKSPVLKKVQLELNDNVSGDEELEMLKKLVQHPYSPASPSAQLFIERS